MQGLVPNQKKQRPKKLIIVLATFAPVIEASKKVFYSVFFVFVIQFSLNIKDFKPYLTLGVRLMQ